MKTQNHVYVHSLHFRKVYIFLIYVQYRQRLIMLSWPRSLSFPRSMRQRYHRGWNGEHVKRIMCSMITIKQWSGTGGKDHHSNIKHIGLIDSPSLLVIYRLKIGSKISAGGVSRITRCIAKYKPLGNNVLGVLKPFKDTLQIYAI